MQHGTFLSNTCVLLQKTGAFHLESDDGNSTKVFEGSMNSHDLQGLLNNVHDLFDALSKQSIEEPLLSHHELLRLDVSRNGHWIDVQFLSVESQEPFQKSLQPLIRWLSELHKLPHKELSEDEGKNNCLAPGEIALKKRNDPSQPQSAEINRTGGPPHSAQTAQSVSPAVSSEPTQAGSAGMPSQQPGFLLRMDLFGMKSNVFHDDCVLITVTGTYRVEAQSQKTGSKTVNTKLHGGQLTPIEISQLRKLLDDPALAKIRHRESSHLVRPVSGDIIELEIPRSSGLQDLVLSSTFDRPGIPFFYSGDGDISRARPLLEFLAEHVQNEGLGTLDPQQRNDCQSAP